MKKIILFSAFALLSIVGFSSCSNCKKCHAEMLGVKGPEQEFCGEELKTAQNTAGMVCAD